MTWARVKATGFGEINWRLMIEGWPYEFVTHADMVSAASDQYDRPRVNGLKAGGIKFSEQVDIPRAELQANGFRVRIADNDQNATAAFSTRPTVVTYLEQNITTSGTTLTVKSTTGFASSGVLYLDQEAIKYTGTSGGNQFTGLTRGHFGTRARAHYTSDGARLSFPEVTDVPVLLEGRRCYLYAYGPGDDKQGDGTQMWIGVARTGPRFSGVEWSFTIDSVASVIEVDIGQDVADPVPIRGIYYHTDDPLLVEIVELSGTTPGSSETARVIFAFAGFFETQQAFCTALNDAIDDAYTTPDSGAFTEDEPRAVVNGTSWAFRFSTDSTPHWLRISARSPVDLCGGLGVTGGPVIDTVLGQAIGAVVAQRSYKVPLEGGGGVPRTVFSSSRLAEGYLNLIPDAHRYLYDYDGTLGTWSNGLPSKRLHLGGDAQIDNATGIQVEWTSTGVLAGVLAKAGTEDFDAGRIATGGVSTTQRWITVGRPPIINNLYPTGVSHYSCMGPPGPQIRLFISYNAANGARSALGTFLSAVATDADNYVTLGTHPDIRTTDFNLNELNAANNTTPLSKRFFRFGDSTSLKEIITHELRLRGAYPAINSSGQLTFRMLKLPSAAEIQDVDLTKSTIIVGDNLLSYEQSAHGLINTVVFKTGYDPKEDEWLGPTYKVRDVAAFGQSPKPRVLEVAPRSEGIPQVTMEDYVNTASKVLGIFGGPYAYLTVSVPLKLWDAYVGDLVSVTWAKVPENTGSLGVSDKIGLVVGREWKPMENSGELTILLHDQRIGGYVPAAKISSISGTSGTTGPFVLTLDTSYLPSGTNCASWWFPDDLIRVYQYGGGSTIVLGTVTSRTGSTVTITTTTNWTTAGTWALGSRVSTAIVSETQKTFVYLAGTDALLDWSGDDNNAPFTFAP